MSFDGNTQNPRVSVFCHVYNGEAYIEEMIRSVLNQTFVNFEFIILDDGSTDGTARIVQPFLGDRRMKYVYQENIGRSGDAFDKILNRGLELTKGELFCVLGADDIFLPHKLERQVREFDRYPYLDVLFSNAYHIDAKGNVLPSDFRCPEALSFTDRDLLRILFVKNIVPHPTVMMKRSSIDLMGGFETGFAPDYQFWLKSAPFLKFKYLDEKLMKYRIHDKGYSTSNPDRSRKEAVKIISSMRDLYTIEDLYPEILYCSNINHAIYSAHLDFGNRLMLAYGSDLVSPLAVKEYNRAHEIKPDGLEAIWNLTFLLWLGGDRSKSVQLLAHLEEFSPKYLWIRQNHYLIRQLKAGKGFPIRSLKLLSETPQTSELLRKIEFTRTPQQNERVKRLDLKRPGIKKRLVSSPPKGAQKDGLTDRFPFQAHFLMIDKCNAKCIFCGGNYFYSETNRRITLQKFQKMATNLKLERFQKIVLAGAGDPLLNPDLIPIIQYTNQRYPNVRVSITTNGIALTEEMAEALLQCKISDLNVSINAATRNVYKRMMQVDCFEKVCRNVERLVALRRKKGAGPVLQFSSPINRLNIEDLPALVELGKGIGIDSINIFYTRFYPERIRHLNVDREEDRLNNQDSLFYYQDLSDQMVEKAKWLAGKYGIHFFHEPLFKEFIIPQPCVWPETQLMVGFDGEIYPCGGAEVHFKEKVEGGIYHFGNALTQPIEEFWNGDIYRLLRISSKGGEDCPVTECKVCANRMNPRDEKAHIMQWDAPEIATCKEMGEKIDTLREREAERERPLVSVIVPTYNRPNMLLETLKSILNQTYSNYEVIVVNDAGVDVEKVVTLLDSSGRIAYVRHSKNQGLAAARNTGLKMAEGKYIAYLDDDDIYYPDHLETLVNFLENSDYKVAYTDAYRSHQKRVGESYVVERRDLPYSFDFDYDRILVENFVPVLCFMHEKSCLEEVGFFDESLTTLEDWDLWIRMSRKFKFAHIPKITCEFSWREDGSSMTSEKRIHFIRNQKRIYEKYRCYSKDKPELANQQEAFLKNYGEMVNQEYDRIQQLISKNLIEDAIIGLERLLILTPLHSLAHDDLGVLYFHRGDTERALYHFTQSLQSDPKNRNALKNLADLKQVMGETEEALRLYQKILTKELTDVDALLGMAKVCTQTDRADEAKFYYSKVLEIEPARETAKQGLNILSKGLPESPIPKSEVPLEKETPLPEGDQRLISITILIHNQLEYTKKCLESIFRYTDLPYELLIVDNGSTDGTMKFLNDLGEGRVTVGGWRIRVGEDGELVGSWLKNEKGKKKKKLQTQKTSCQRFKVIRNEKNLGFAAGNNQGMAEARGEYIVLMNNDVVVTTGWLNRMIAVAERNPKIGIVGPMSNYVSGPQWVSQVGYDTATLTGLNQFAQDYSRRHLGQAKPFWRVVGFCMLIKRAVVEKIGGLDSRYGLGNFEDDDFSLRARLAGFESWIAEDCFVHHFGSRTFAGSGIDYSESLKRNWEIFKKKWGIPSEIEYGAPFDLSEILSQGFDPVRHYCPLTPEEYSLSRGEELFQAGDVEGAKLIFNRLLQENPDEVDLLNNLGVIAYQEGEFDQAITYFNRALTLNPDHLDALENLGHCMVAKGAYREAVQYFERALELKPGDLSLLNSLGNCLIQTGDFLRAEDVYHRSYEIDETQMKVREILAGLERLKSMETERRAAP